MDQACTEWHHDAEEAVMDNPEQWSRERVLALAKHLEQKIEDSGLKLKKIDERVKKREGWTTGLLQGWRGKGRRGRAPTLETLLLLAYGMRTTVRDLLDDDFLDEPH